MSLSDRSIKLRMTARLDWQRLGIEPFDENQLQGASYDMRLSNELLVADGPCTIRLASKTRPVHHTLRQFTEYMLMPDELVLAASVEYVRIPEDMQAVLKGKSSHARDGLIVENAGYFDPGFHGTATLELKNISQNLLVLEPGMLIAQLVFDTLSSRARRPYGHKDLRSKYNGQRSPTAAQG